MPVKIMPREEKQKPEPEQNRVDVKLMGPGKYEVSNDTTFEIDLFLQVKGKRWVVVADGKDVVRHRVVFRMWTYDEMVEMRKMATSYDAARRIHIIDQDALNRMKIQKLLVSWTFGNDNPRLELKHVNGVLTDESWTAFCRLQPNITNHIIYEMNKVYEYNG